MLISTTMHIHALIMKKLNDAGRTSGKPVNIIIIMLLKRALKDNRRMPKIGSRIRYQQMDPEHRWHRQHVKFEEKEYEFFLDLRKLYKMSLSFILAYAVNRFLKSLLYELTTLPSCKGANNFLAGDYVLVSVFTNNYICWELFWGHPGKKVEPFH